MFESWPVEDQDQGERKFEELTSSVLETDTMAPQMGWRREESAHVQVLAD